MGAVSDKDEKCAALHGGSDADGSWPVSHLTASGSFVRSSIRAFQQLFDTSSTLTTTSASAESTNSRLRSTSRAELKTSSPSSTTTELGEASFTSSTKHGCHTVLSLFLFALLVLVGCSCDLEA